MVKRLDIINALIARNGYKDYLGIGVGDWENFISGLHHADQVAHDICNGFWVFFNLVKSTKNVQDFHFCQAKIDG